MEQDNGDVEFHDSPLPIVDLWVTTEPGSQTPEKVEVLINSGASLNLIAAAAAARILRNLEKGRTNNGETEGRRKMPTINHQSRRVN